MSAVDLAGPDKRPSRSSKPAAIFLLAAAVLLLGSAALQHHASVQRWVVFAGSRPASESFGEDHLYDYYFPLEPWINIGTTAQFFGAGILIQAFAVVVIAIGLLLAPQIAKGRYALLALGEFGIAIVVAATFAVLGTHALNSGIDGAPSPLQHMWALGHIGLLGLLALAWLWWRKLRTASVACLFLTGSTFMGYFLAMYLIAPIVTSGGSHDTTRWTESVVAASTAAAAVAIIMAARALLWPRQRKRRALHRL